MIDVLKQWTSAKKTLLKLKPKVDMSYAGFMNSIWNHDLAKKN
jgi:hypothetical protein